MDDKKKFILKFITFIGFALVFPVGYIYVRCQLWKVKTTISFWFLVLMILVGFVVSVLIKYYLDGMKTKYSFFKQVLTGVLKVILPLSAVLLIAIWYKGKVELLVQNINLFIEIIGITIVSEIIAIIINPLPKWAFDNNVEGLVEISDKILNKKGE